MVEGSMSRKIGRVVRVEIVVVSKTIRWEVVLRAGVKIKIIS
jgi:hypothetical protein